MSIDIPYSEFSSVSFGIHGDQENEIDAVGKVMYMDSVRNGIPFPGGISDRSMGTSSHDYNCSTCKYTKKFCPGHFNVLYLNYPVLSPFFLKEIIKWLKIICFNCGKIIIPVKKLPIRKDKILTEYVKLSTRATNKNIICVNCSSVHPYITKDKSDPVSIIMEFYDTKNTSSRNQPVVRLPLNPHLIRTVFNKISDETVINMGKPLISHPKKFIISSLRIPPVTIRPDIRKMGAGRSNNNDLTVLLQTIVRINDELPVEIPSAVDKELQIKIHNICLAVHDLIKGSSGTGKRSIVNNSKKPLMSIAKRFPRKYGRIRRNLLGRRANHMARSFITCDPYLKIDEVGVPISIARNLQFPEIVREYNYDQMLIYFMNGTKRYPGCTKIKKVSNGKTYFVDKVAKLEIGDTIYRDMVNGDIVCFNRQPSLEPSSISSMKVVIMEHGETFRINLSACVLFNADFDGDAMNLLASLSNRTVNEIGELSSPARFFIAYKDASPKIGSAQDALIGCAKFTKSSVKIDKFHAMKMFSQIKVYHDFSKYPIDKIFTGREIFSILLKETGNLINYTGIAATYKENQASFRKYDPRDIKVEIDRGELKTGVLDKASIGEGAHGGLYHIIHNQYGARTALEASYNIQQLIITYLFNRGVTVSIRDILLKDDAVKEIQKISESLIADSLKITDDLNQGKLIPPIGKTINEYYEELQMNALNPGDDFWQYILGSIDPDNNDLYEMIMSGSRGKLWNFAHISSSLGQAEINGERMLENFNGRTFPYFTKYDSNPGSRGFVVNSYILGMTVTEFLFSSQVARYAIINKALSTSITGMYNRFSIKNLESAIVDNLRRLSNDQLIIQLLYGIDGSDPRFVEKVKFPTMKKDMSNQQFEDNFRSNINLFEKEFQNKSVQKLLDDEFSQLKQDRDFYRKVLIDIETTGGPLYSDSISMPVNINRIIEDTLYNLELKKYSGIKINPVKTIEKVNALCVSIMYCLYNETQEKSKTDIPKYIQFNTTFLQILIRSYLNTSFLVNKNITDDALDIIIQNIRLVYLKSLIGYGMAAGIISAQSVCEPLTQAVLDSHHNAGASSTKKKGMFRVKEILGATPTDKMKSPSMVLHVLPEYEKNESKVREIANHIEMLNIRKFIINWQIFYEKYGEPLHPSYKHEKSLIKDFEKYNVHVKVPSDLANWCIRLQLDKSKMIEKQMKIETIYHVVRQTFPATHIVYSTDNSDIIVMRIYIRNIISKKNIDTKQMKELSNDILNTIVRGIKGIRAAYVQSTPKTVIKEDGSVSNENNYFIFTDGTNMEKILENPYILHDTAQSDSIIEMYEIAGITAARRKIVDELKAQIGDINMKHFYLYADVQTNSGSVSSINRYGNAARSNSPLLLLSDANPLLVLENAAVNGLEDNLSGVSPRIILGSNVNTGSLYNTFILDEEFVKEKTSNLSSLI